MLSWNAMYEQLMNSGDYIQMLQILQFMDKKTEGYYICEQIILSSQYDFNQKNYALQQLAKYIHVLPTLSNIKFSCTTPYPYHVSSNSITKIKDGYLCNMRAINYIYTSDGDYISKDNDGIVRTDNYIMHVDDHFNISQCRKLICNQGLVHPCHIMGMEDVRLFGEKYFLCTRLDATTNHVPCVCLGTIDGDMKILKPNNNTEKNWLPMYDNEHICNVIYSFEPLTIYSLDVQTGETNKIMEEKMNNYDLSTFRGSAVPIKYKNGWLMTVHQVYYHKKRHYYHRFLWLSDDYKSIKYSNSFYFHKIGVEFNLGIAHHEKGLIVCYSVDDANPMLSIVDYDYLDQILF